MDDRDVSCEVSDRWLRTFVLAVESGTFSEASRRLGVSQPAVSHSVARLEAVLGQRLLNRGSRSLELTDVGRRLNDEVAPAFGRIDAAVRIAAGTDSTAVTLSVSTSLANFWLLPRLPGFKRNHPDVDLRVITTDTDVEVGNDDADLWIPLGRIDRADLASARFRVERLVPVASPPLARRLSIIEPGDLIDAPLIHLEERYAGRFDWRRWFELHDVDVPGPLAGDHTNDYSLVLEAALDGQGVALGWLHIVAELLSSGRLVALAEPIESDNPFLIHWRRNRPLRPEVKALRDWLVESGTR